MAGPSRKRRDSKLIDAIEAIAPVIYSETVWRVVRRGRDPTQCSRSGGRWDDGTFDVLYTSQEREGALAEMRFHLMRGQPVMPSRVTYNLFEIDVALRRALKLLDFVALYGMILMPMGAIVFVDFWLAGRLGFRAGYAEKSGTTFNWAAGLTWFATLGACVALVSLGHVQIYFVSLPGWFVAAALYVVLSRLLQARVLAPAAVASEAQ